MVLSNSKLKRKKREEAVLNPPPDSSATPSVANDVKGESPALASAKKKKKKPKSKAINGDAEEVAAGSGAVPERDAVEGEAVVQQPKKKKSKAAPVVEEAVVAAEDAGVSTENGVDGAAPVQDGEPKTKIRKKPRWEVDADGKRVKPQRAGGEAEGEGHPNGAKAAASPSKGAESGDVHNGAAAVPDAVNDGDRIHQGDEPWLQSKRKEKKKKKKQTDKWGKKIEEAEAVAVAVDNEEAPQVASSTEEKVDPKKVIVGGMPYYISEDDIHEYFQECGTIAELDCMTFPDTGKFKGIAFITFRTEEAAKRALAMDGADMGGRHLKIEMCKIRPKEPSKKSAFKEPPKKYEGCLSAYIGNLAWDVTEKELRKFFKGCKIESIRFAEDKVTGEFKGFGHVDFADDESLEAAMKLDQMPVLDRPLKIAYSVPLKNKAVEARPGQGGDRKKGCYNCGEEGHMSYNCPSKL